MRDDFAVFILTHGRPDKQITLKFLQKQNYSGKWYLLLDDEDDTIDEYVKRYGKEKIKVFSKKDYDNRVMFMDNFNGPREIITYARHAVFDVAKELGLKYFLMLDDDLGGFYIRFYEGKKSVQTFVNNLDESFEMFLDLLDKTGALTITTALAGDYIGGAHNEMFKNGYKRKAMNTFFCRVDRPINFMGRFNEDVVTYVHYGNLGELFFAVGNCYVAEGMTQNIKGGMTDSYKLLGTYVKSFYAVMVAPSSVKIGVLSNVYYRIHHKIFWRNAVPRIVSDKYKRVGEWQKEEES
jgi:hypothetical protein